MRETVFSNLAAMIKGPIKLPLLPAAMVISTAAHVGVFVLLANITTGSGNNAETHEPAVLIALGRPVESDVAPEHEVIPEPEHVDPEIDLDIESKALVRPTHVVETDQRPPIELETRAKTSPVTEPKPPTASVSTRITTHHTTLHKKIQAMARALQQITAQTSEHTLLEQPTIEQTMVEPATARTEIKPIETTPVVTEHSPLPVTAAHKGIDQGAQIIDWPTPIYPPRAVRLGHEGTVVIEVELSATGNIKDVRLRQSSEHPLLDRAALKAARAGRYTTAIRNGEPVSAVLVIPFEFNLR